MAEENAKVMTVWILMIAKTAGILTIVRYKLAARGLFGGIITGATRERIEQINASYNSGDLVMVSPDCSKGFPDCPSLSRYAKPNHIIFNKLTC